MCTPCCWVLVTPLQGVTDSMHVCLPVVANCVPAAGPYRGCVSHLRVSPSLRLWDSQSCSLAACPEPHAAGLPVFSSLPAPPILLMRCSSLVPGQAYSAPFLSPSWTEPGLTTQLPGQRAQLPRSSMESGCTQGLARNGQIRGFSVVPRLSLTLGESRIPHAVLRAGDGWGLGSRGRRLVPSHRWLFQSKLV